MQEIINSIKEIAIKIADEVKFADLSYTQSQNCTGDTQLNNNRNFKQK